MNAPDALQNIRSKHPVAYVVLYLFVGWALLVVITHAIAFGAELLIASSDQPVVKWEATDECTDGSRTIYYNSPSLYQEFKVKIKDSKIVDAELGSLSTIGATVNAEQVEHTDSHATYRIDLSILGRPSRTCLLECDVHGTTLHMSEIQMRPGKEISSRAAYPPARLLHRFEDGGLAEDVADEGFGLVLGLRNARGCTLMAEGAARTGVGLPGSCRSALLFGGSCSGLGRGRRTRHVERRQIVPARIAGKAADHSVVVGHLLGFPRRGLRDRLSLGGSRALGRTGCGLGRELTHGRSAGGVVGA